MGCSRDRLPRFRMALLQARAEVGASMLRRGAAMLALAGATPTVAGAQRPAVAASLMFDGVTVVDVESGKLVPDQRVVITGNRIQTVGGVGAVKLSKGVQVVDA